MLLHLAGPEMADTYETHPEPTGAEVVDAYDRCKAKLKLYLAPARNVIAERMEFHRMTMADGEEFEHFLGRLSIPSAGGGGEVAELRTC